MVVVWWLDRSIIDGCDNGGSKGSVVVLTGCGGDEPLD